MPILYGIDLITCFNKPGIECYDKYFIEKPK